MKAIVNLFLKPSLLGAALLLLLTTPAHSQDDVMRVYSKDGAVYAINTAQVDSVTFTFDCEANCSGLECMNMPRPEDSYDYSTLWEQVPIEILQGMPIQTVIQAIWEYSFFGMTMLSRYYYQADFEYYFSENNAYLELTKRADASVALLERLRLINPLGATSNHRALELVMSQEVFLSQLTDKERCKLIEITLMKDALRQSCGIKSHSMVVWILIGRTLASANYAPVVEEMEKNTELKDFLYYRNYLYHPPTLDRCCAEDIKFITEFIFTCANKYVKEIKS